MLLEEHTDDSVILKLVSRLIVMKLLLNPNQPTSVTGVRRESNNDNG